MKKFNLNFKNLNCKDEDKEEVNFEFDFEFKFAENKKEQTNLWNKERVLYEIFSPKILKDGINRMVPFLLKSIQTNENT